MDAINHRYLQSVCIGVAQDAEATSTVEEFEFRLRYHDDLEEGLCSMFCNAQPSSEQEVREALPSWLS